MVVHPGSALPAAEVNVAGGGVLEDADKARSPPEVLLAAADFRIFVEAGAAHAGSVGPHSGGAAPCVEQAPRGRTQKDTSDIPDVCRWPRSVTR